MIRKNGHYMLTFTTLNVNLINMLAKQSERPMPQEQRTARLTLLIDPDKKKAFEALCLEEDVTPSQKVRQFIRDYVEARLGPDWKENLDGRAPDNS